MYTGSSTQYFAEKYLSQGQDYLLNCIRIVNCFLLIADSGTTPVYYPKQILTQKSPVLTRALVYVEKIEQPTLPRMHKVIVPLSCLGVVFQ